MLEKWVSFWYSPYTANEFTPWLCSCLMLCVSVCCTGQHNHASGNHAGWYQQVHLPREDHQPLPWHQHLLPVHSGGRDLSGQDWCSLTTRESLSHWLLIHYWLWICSQSCQGGSEQWMIKPVALGQSGTKRKVFCFFFLIIVQVHSAPFSCHHRKVVSHSN